MKWILIGSLLLNLVFGFQFFQKSRANVETAKVNRLQPKSLPAPLERASSLDGSRCQKNTPEPNTASNESALEKVRASANDWLRQGRADKAAAALKESLKENPTSAEVNMDLGLVYAHSLNDPKLAAEYFETSLRSEPANGRVIHELAQIYAKQIDSSPGRAFLESLAQANPDLEAAHLGLAELMMSQGNRARAETYLENAVKSAHPEGDAHLMLSRLYAESGRKAEALELLKSLVTIKESDMHRTDVDPQVAQASLNNAEIDLTNALIDQGDFKAASTRVEHLASVLPNDGRIRALMQRLPQSAE